MTTENTPDQLLMGGGAIFFTWAAKNQIGQYVTKPYGQTGRTRVAGYISRIGGVEQQSDFNTKALLTWPDGKPKQQFAITLDVDWQNTSDWKFENGGWVPAGPNDADDRQRGIMIKQSSALQGALRDAIKQSGADKIEVGAYVTVELTAEVPGQGNPRKEYAVQYTRPANNVAMGGGQPQGQMAQQPQQYAQQGVPQGQVTQYAQQAPPPPPPQQYAQQGQAAPPPPPPQQYAQQGQAAPPPPPPQQYAQQGQVAPPPPPPQQYAQQGQVAPPPPPQQYAQQPPPQQYAQQAPQGQAAPQGQQQDPWAVAKRLLHELKLPPDQVAAATGLTVEQVQQIPPF